MKPVIENFEIRQNNFIRLLFLILAILSLVGSLILINQSDDKKWITLICFVLAVVLLVISGKHKIIISQFGFEVQYLTGSRVVQWEDITKLDFETSYGIQTVHLELKIFASNNQMTAFQVKYYQPKPMQRFFEILNEQCVAAYKNEHFINQSTRKMNWRNKLKMF